MPNLYIITYEKYLKEQKIICTGFKNDQSKTEYL